MEAAHLLATVNAVLQDQSYLALDRFTVADIGVALAAQRWFMLVGKFDERLDTAADMPALQHWLETVTQRSAYGAANRPLGGHRQPRRAR